MYIVRASYPATALAAELHLLAIAQSDGTPQRQTASGKRILRWVCYDQHAAFGLAERLREVSGVRVMVDTLV